MVVRQRQHGGLAQYITTMRTTLIVIIIVVPLLVFRTTETHVIVHLYPKYSH